jgi:hypothetical protein
MAAMHVYTIHSSRLLRIYLAGLHLLALVAVLSADLSWLIQLGLAAVALTSSVKTWPRPTVERLRCLESVGLELFQDGGWRGVDLLPQTVVTPFLSVLCLAPLVGGRHRYLTILPDCLDADDYRRLRVCLKRQARQGAGGH